MSGFEIVGVVLGGLPLVIHLAEKYKQGFEPVASWWKFRPHFRDFIHSVALQKHMFDSLVCRLLRHTDLSEDQQRRLMLEPDRWNLQENVSALESLLGDFRNDFFYLLEKFQEDLVALQRMLQLKDGGIDWIRPGERQWDYQRKRISMSLSKKHLKIVELLEKHNQSLRAILDQLDFKLTKNLNQVHSLRRTTTWPRLYGCIRNHAAFLHSTLSCNWNCDCGTPHSAALQLQERATQEDMSQFSVTLGIPSDAQALSIHVLKAVVTANNVMGSPYTQHDEEKPLQIKEPWYLETIRSTVDKEATTMKPESMESCVTNDFSHDLKFTKLRSALKTTTSNITFTSESNAKSTQPLNMEVRNSKDEVRQKLLIKKTARVSLGSLSHAPKANPINESTQPSLEEQVRLELQIKDICSAKATIDSTRAFLGYLSGNETEDQIVSLQSDRFEVGAYELVSLETILRKSTQLELTREQRFKLAGTFASSVLQLSTSPWLPGGLQKQDIYFYHEGIRLLDGRPYIYQKFWSNRSAFGSLPPVPNLAVPPRDSLVNLGILLLELCFGDVIENQRDLRDGHLIEGKAHKSTDLLTALEWMYKVGGEAGMEFENAIKWCLQPRLDIKSRWEDGEFSEMVHAGVVEPLEKVVNIWNAE